jgi:signal transduction histidine kinase
MRELSLNVLDIAQNSITAGATLIEIELNIFELQDKFEIVINDNGKGIEEEFLKKITDPFVTTRTTRKVGMGLPLFKFSAEQSGGQFKITSKVGKGTVVKAEYIISSIDRMPLGNIEDTIISLIISSDKTDILFKVKADKGEGYLDTREIRKELDGISLNSIEVIDFIKDYLSENLSYLYGGLV